MPPRAKKAAKKNDPPPVKKAVKKGAAKKAAPKKAAKKVVVVSPAKSPVKSPKPLAKTPKSAKAKSPKATPATRGKTPKAKSPAKSPKVLKSPKVAKSPKARIAKSPGPKAALGDPKTAKKEKAPLKLKEGPVAAIAAPVAVKQKLAEQRRMPVLSDRVMDKVNESRLRGAWALLPEGSERPVVVKPERKVLVGRHRDATVRLDDRRISVYHAELRLLFLTEADRMAKAPGLYLRSLSDNNPCRVNGMKVRKWTLLRPGDAVEFVPGICFYPVAPKEAPKKAAPVFTAPAPAKDEPLDDEESEWESDPGVCGFCFCDSHTTDCCPYAGAHVKKSRIETALAWKGFLGPKPGRDQHTDLSFL